jgi:hypothetical protein
MSYPKEAPIELAPLFDEVRKRQAEMAGQFPDGRLTDRDEGTLVFGVTTLGEKVIIAFGQSATWIGMTGDQAIELGTTLIEHGKDAGITKPITIKI